MKRLVIFSSGEGTNLIAIIEAINKNILFNCKIEAIISNYNSQSIKTGLFNSIPSYFIPCNNKSNRTDYDISLAQKVNSINPDLIVLAGWNHILSKDFLNAVDMIDIINLHPALLGQFPGNNAIEDAWDAFQKGAIKHTGIMVHKVTDILDVGEVVNELKVPIHNSDTLIDLKNRIQTLEKKVLIEAIHKMTTSMIYRGKVKDVYRLDDDKMLIAHSDRLSACNRYVCDIEGKGFMLCLLSNYFFKKTEYIIPNHIIDTTDNCMIVHKCKQIPIEFIVRAYITGSLWKAYSEGTRVFCGVNLPEGLKKNQMLEAPIITPTTKDEFDDPISLEEIVDRNILKKEDLEYIIQKTHELFIEGQYESKLHNLILVDTKYEFGRRKDGTIILIDEIHTIESSRYWKRHNYEERLSKGEEPEKLDKDCVREYIKECPTLNDGLKSRVLNSYISVYNSFTYNTISVDNCMPFKKVKLKKIIDKYTTKNNVTVIILSGSPSDEEFVTKIESELNNVNIYPQRHICSAHKNTEKLLCILKKYKNDKTIFITVAGMSNALSGIVACNTDSVVIACPPMKSLDDLNTNINSTLQMPSNVPVMTILSPKNVALSCERIIKLITI